MAEHKTSSVEKGTANADVATKSLRHRRVYLRIRLPKLREELKAIGDEHTTIVEKLKGAGLGAAEQKALRDQDIYINERRRVLKTELQMLALERGQVTQKLRNMRV